jgi:hypothetical protein
MKLNKEKYLSYELGLTIIFFIYYISLTLQSLNNNETALSIYLNVAIGYTIAVIILVLLLLFFTKSKSIENDERDKIIESKAYRNAFISTISIINILIILGIVVGKLFEPFIIFNILFALLFISHIIHNITQLYYYKRGV